MKARMLAALALLNSAAAQAVDSGIAPLGFTGALSTPMAGSLASGEAALAYGNYLDGVGLNNRGHNFLTGVGLAPGLEVFARLAANSIHTNCFTANCGIRDLSASVKYTLPDMLQPASLHPWLPKLAVGTTDQGGGSNATNFRTYYGVATWQSEQFAVSGGLAKRDAGKANLNGAFASVVWQPLAWGQAILEQDGTRPQVGFRFLTPAETLPYGARLQLEVRTGQPRTAGDAGVLGGRSLWYGLSLRLPLGGDVEKPSSAAAWPVARAALAEPARATTAPVAAAPLTLDALAASAQKPMPADAPAPAVIRDVREAVPQDATARARDLAVRLASAGFQDIRVGQQGDGRWAVRVENQVFAWNDLDALGVALGEVARWSSGNALAVDLAVLRRGQPVFRIGGDSACLAQWLQEGRACASGHLQSLPTRLDEGGVTWLVRDWHPTRWRPRIELSPELRYALGTEYGALDTDWSLATKVEVPLGLPGLVVEGRWLTPVTQSRNFAPNMPFAASAAQGGLDRALVHQYLTLPANVRLHLAAGRVLGDQDGGYAEVNWRTQNGRHAVSWLAGQLNSPTFRSRPALLSYRYQLPDSDTQLRVQAGEFLDADRGYLVGLRRDFGDTLVTLFYRSTKPVDGSQSVPFAGVEVSLPLTPRRNRPFDWGQIAGNGDQRQSLQTRVGTVANFLSANPLGRFGTAPGSLDSTVLNRDRAGDDYLMNHLERLRNAHERYVADAWRFQLPVSDLSRMYAP